MLRSLIDPGTFISLWCWRHLNDTENPQIPAWKPGLLLPQGWRTVTISDLSHLWFLWFESTSASVEGAEQAAVALDLVHWSPSRNEPTCHRHVLSWTLCSVINNRLIGQKGLGCLSWICATKVTGQTVVPGFAGGLHFRTAVSKYKRKVAQSFPTFGKMQDHLHHTHYLTEKGAGNPLIWQYRLKCYDIYCTAFPDAVWGHFCGQQMGESEPVWGGEQQREILEIIWDNICRQGKWMSRSWTSC